jgi:uncharacterized protein (DUF2062 family)
LVRSRQSPDYTARGVANGVFWALTPTVGLQTAEIVATWFVAGRLFGRESSLVQALIWVWINNPVTMVPMYYGFYLTGLTMTGTPSTAAGYESFLSMWTRADIGWLQRITSTAAAVALPTIVGCLPYAIGGGMLSYFWALRFVRRRHAARPPSTHSLPSTRSSDRRARL